MYKWMQKIIKIALENKKKIRNFRAHKIKNFDGSSAQLEWAIALISKIELKRNERILDIG